MDRAAEVFCSAWSVSSVSSVPNPTTVRTCTSTATAHARSSPLTRRRVAKPRENLDSTATAPSRRRRIASWRRRGSASSSP
eukprot:148253-Prorocentrum_minimum.AAC.1